MLSQHLADLLTIHRVELVGGIRLKESLCSHLIAKEVLTDDDKEILTVSGCL